MALRPILSVVGFSALYCAAPALAQAVDGATDAEAPAHVIRLTPEQREAAMADGSEKKVDAALAQATGGGAVDDDALDGIDRPDRRVHGEVGFMIGTGGTRGFYGAAAIPLGDNAGAMISFSQQRYGLPRYRRR
ncbi:hypothetical protein [Sphingomonas flavalba]|uniref:hypothetical protein n=1 Tax=Sphingomonas flavalba TaxID=2559804 RepID=UPI00109E2EDE|nr:hypothetical protein [Sphingomonas flavalba]